jgi:hypothetical protein
VLIKALANGEVRKPAQCCANGRDAAR